MRPGIPHIGARDAPDAAGLEELVDADAIARVLGVNRLRVYQLARDGVLPCVRIGRQVRFLPSAIREWIGRGGSAAA